MFSTPILEQVQIDPTTGNLVVHGRSGFSRLIQFNDNASPVPNPIVERDPGLAGTPLVKD